MRDGISFTLSVSAFEVGIAVGLFVGLLLVTATRVVMRLVNAIDQIRYRHLLEPMEVPPRPWTGNLADPGPVVEVYDYESAPGEPMESELWGGYLESPFRDDVLDYDNPPGE